MKGSISEREFLKQFVSSESNILTGRYIGIMTVFASLFAWFTLGRPTMTVQEISELTIAWLAFLALFVPFLFGIGWGDWVKADTPEERVKKGKVFWDDPYNNFLYWHVLGYITASLIIFLLIPDQSLFQRLVWVIWHLGGYAILGLQVRLSRLPPYTKDGEDT